MTTPYHAKYFAHDLTRHARSGDADCLSMALFDACVDLNPHQIEAGLVLCQYWAERKRKLIVICPASLRKQWSLELLEKFNLPSIILDSKSYRHAQKDGDQTPFSTDKVVVTSYNYASRMRGDLRAVPFDLVVIDEAHKLRNAYRASNKIGQNIKWAVEERKKCLLTATPLQNTLLELYGLSTVIDDLIFGDLQSFRSQYTGIGADLPGLSQRLKSFCHRTLRRQVVEYIQYTKRKPITVRFRPSNEEQQLYDAVSEFLSRELTFSIPTQQRHLLTLLLRKLLASSSQAIAGTLETMKTRLEDLREKSATVETEKTNNRYNDADHDGIPMLVSELVEREEFGDEYLDEESDDEDGIGDAQVDLVKLNAEIDELDRYATWARGIGVDTKSRSLLKALELGFTEMAKAGANRKCLVFTESRRTQDYLKTFLETNGYAGQVVLFNGTNSDPDSRAVIDNWISKNRPLGRVSGSRPVDSRTALIEHFRDDATIMVATEAAAEGVNMQFCSMIVNYDLPWNPQRIEQRIGRCHRYGQQHDVVVINFLNERNEADRRVHELLSEKFNLFEGVFGASDEVLGQIESGVDFEKRILAIYQQCRTTEQIDEAFQLLQAEMDEKIQSKMDDTRRQLIEHFDEDVHAKLKMRLDDTRANLDRISRQFWALSRFVLRDHAAFCEDSLSFELSDSPIKSCEAGRYHLISKDGKNRNGNFLYRLSHPLGEWSIDQGKQQSTPVAKVTFDITGYSARVALVEALEGKSGWLTLQHLTVDSFGREEHLLFSATDAGGKSLDQETCQKLFHCSATVGPTGTVANEHAERLTGEARRHAEATIASSLENNNRLFNEERERLEKWADDMVVAAEKELGDTKVQVKVVRRQSRLATTLDEQNDLQLKLRELERKQRKQRQQIFDIEDEIADKRDTLIEGLQRRMAQQTSVKTLFTIQWEVV